MNMDDRVVSLFLDAGLLDLQGQDSWYGYITDAADQLGDYLAEHPANLPSFIYSAVSASNRSEDPARKKALATLRDVWRTFASVSIGSVDTILRGILLDAVVQNADRDPQFKVAATLFLSSALPHLDHGAESRVWQNMINNLLQEVEVKAEANWSVPTEVDLPPLPDFETPELEGRLSAKRIDEESTLARVYKAVGPTNSENQPTSGNDLWPNNGQQWALQFAPLAAEAINEGLKTVAGSRNFNLNADSFMSSIRAYVESYIVSVSERLMSASQGVDLRSRLLWWKEAKISSSAHIEYRKLDSTVMPGLVAFDYQQMLPPLAPISVIAFLKESVRSLVDDADIFTLQNYLEALRKSENFSHYRRDDHTMSPSYQSLADLAVMGISDEDSIANLTVFSPAYEIVPDEFASLLFLELQAKKATESLVPYVKSEQPSDEFETETESPDDDVDAEA